MEVNGRGAKKGREREKGWGKEGREKGEVGEKLTRGGERIVVRAQAQEEEERGEPYADREECRHLSESG